MIRLRISDDTLHDLNEGFLFYEAQQPGLGDFIGDTPMRMPTAAHDAHNSSSNLRFDPFCALARANPSLMQPCGRRGNWLLG